MIHPQSSIDDYIDDTLEKFPEFLRPKDLVKAGLYKSTSDLCWAMKRNQAPPFIKLSSHKVIFLKSALCEWIREKARIDSIGGQENVSET
jgi:predicted DNA-binding transcriptional regulator AlpA